MRESFCCFAAVVLSVGCTDRGVQQLQEDRAAKNEAVIAREFDVKLKCAELGRRYSNEWARGLSGSELASRFKYNVKSNTCFWSGGSINQGIFLRFLVDLLTNEEIAHHNSALGKMSGHENDSAKFEQLELELLGPKP